MRPSFSVNFEIGMGFSLGSGFLKGALLPNYNSTDINAPVKEITTPIISQSIV
jgi:hypothetical protein